MEADKQRNTIQEAISELRKQQSSLSIFRGKEKRAIQEQINEKQILLKQIPSFEEIQERYQPELKRINDDRLAEIQSVTDEISDKYVFPKREDFFDR